MDAISDGEPRTYTIRKSHHLGFGFVAGHDFPTIVKAVEPNGPSFKRLQPYDVIMAVNGKDVATLNRQQIIEFIQSCQDEIKITVRQASYEELLRAKNLSDPRFYTLNKQSGTLPSMHGNRQPTYQLPPNRSPLNRLVTSIAQQQINPMMQFDSSNGDSPPVQVKPSPKGVLTQKPVNGIESQKVNTLSRSRAGYGRHSPLPQRCKSSLEATKSNNKKYADQDNDRPMLKRSNTMRSIKPPSKVLEIFKVVVVIFFENEHTRMLKYDPDTTVGAILETLNARLTTNSPYYEQIKKYFGLALTVELNTKNGSKEQQPKRKLLHILNEDDSIIKISQLPYAENLRFYYRMVHPPSDVSTLYTQDKVAFGYLYQQACNDLKLERFVPELDSKTALKLSALYLLEYVHTYHSKSHGNSKDPKVYINLVKKTPGLEYFVPASMAESVLDKKGRRISGQYKKLRARLTEHLKINFEEIDFEPPKVKSTTNLNCYPTTSFHELSLPEMQSSPSDYIKLLFLNYLSQLPCYGDYNRQVKTSSPIERSSGGDCSSSMESVPRTSDSSPLLRQDRPAQNGQGSIGSRIENPNANNISRLAQMNSMRSINSIQTPTSLQPVDHPDTVQTPSLDSISSITFNMQSSPSPQQPPSFSSQQVDTYPAIVPTKMSLEPSPMPRHMYSAKMLDYNSIDKLYSQRYRCDNKSLDELLKTVVLPPPPPPSNFLFEDTSYSTVHRNFGLRQTRQLTQVLTDRDLEKLRVPPPPRIIK